MTNELILAQKIEKRLQQKRKPEVFPLTPTHRNELRALRDQNIGNLRQQLSAIKELKYEEFKKRHQKDINDKLHPYYTICNSLNDDWKDRLKRINAILNDRKKLEKSYDLDGLQLDNSWSSIADLKDKSVDDHREWTVPKSFEMELYSKLFDERYGKAFDVVREKIDKLVEHYEEAINFGDLEIVKELYYIMKNADSFFKKVEALKV